MRIRTTALACLVGVVVLFLGHEFSSAQPKPDEPSSQIGVVSVRRALRDCKATINYRQKSTVESDKMNAQEDKLSKEVDALAAGVRNLVPGSSDYLAQYKELLQKQAELKVQQELNTQQRTLQHQRWTEDLYREILRITKELAEQKGLALVLESSEPEFPIQRYEELVMTLSTHKVLHTGGCLDITDEVIAELDKQASKLED